MNTTKDPIMREINQVVCNELPRFAVGFKRSKRGRGLMKSEKALLAREGMIEMLAERFPSITQEQLAAATGLDGNQVKAARARAVSRRKEAAPC